jgi:hypothetical protein
VTGGDELWVRWDKREAEGRRIYAVLVPSYEGWTVLLCWQKPSGGALYKFGKSTASKSNDEFQLPERAFAVIPISSVFARVTKRLMGLLFAAKLCRPIVQELVARFRPLECSSR